MKLIIATLIICAIVVYVYFDYENLKSKYLGLNDKSALSESKETEKNENTTEKLTADKTESETKYKVGEELYIDASVGDLIAWQQNRIPAWVTYDGSPNDDSQRVKDYYNHRDIVKVIKTAIGKGGKTWYYVRTPTGFPISGWVEEQYLSKNPPKRRLSQPPDRGM